MTDEQTPKDSQQPESKPSGTPESNPAPVESKPVKKVANEKPQERPARKPDPQSGSARLVFLGFLGVVSVLLLILYILLIVALKTGDVSNPLFEVLGIRDQDLQSTLFLITHSVFGGFTIVFLFAFLIRFFQFFTADREDVRRKRYVKKAMISFVSILILGGAWTGLYILIRDARVVALGNSNLIKTEPEIVSGLSAPVEVKFNISDNLYKQIDEKQITQINWDFDGDEKTDRNGGEVFYTFRNKGKNDGRYTAKATVIYRTINSAKEQVYEATKEIIIGNESISAQIFANKIKGPAPLAVTLNGEGSIDPDGEVRLYEWDLNDDGIYEVKGQDKGKIDHVFQKIGNYPVRLRVQGANNDFDETEQVIEVTNPEKNLKARVTSSQSKEGYAPYTIQLNGEQSFSRRGRILRYIWFIDGQDEVVVSRTLKWTFSTPGQYRVRLQVENDLDEKDEEEIIVTVSPAQKKSTIVIETTPELGVDQKSLVGEVPFEVVFDASRSEVEDPIEWRWDFEDDGIEDAYQQSVKHTFREPGRYETKLTIVDIDGDEFTEVMFVDVESQGVKADIQASPITGVAPLTVKFDGSGSTTDDGEIVNYIWEFPGKEPISYHAQVSYEFPLVGVYEVKLTVLTSDNRIAEDSTLVSVRAQPIEAFFDVTPQAGEAPLAVEFDSSGSKGNIAEYRWNFGDGIISRQKNPRHTFTAPGSYTVMLKIVDEIGLVSEYERVIDVQ